MLPPAHAALDRHLQEYRRRYAWLWSFIQAPAAPSARGLGADPGASLRRLQAFLDFVGHPHRQFPAIHVAGTSGKGSVTMMLARILAAAGYAAGYHVSPYLQLPHEKLAVNDRWIALPEFNALLADFAAVYGRWQRARPRARPWLRYGEAWVALTFLFLARRRVDWGVVECGVGGRWDPTNALQPALSLVTNVGMDHAQTLGGTLESIADHKAGILKTGSLALTGVTQPHLLARMQAEARRLRVELHTVGPMDDPTRPWTFAYAAAPRAAGQLALEIRKRGGARQTWLLRDTARFQAANAALAAAAVDLLQAAGRLRASDAAVQAGLGQGAVPGRMEIMQAAPAVILDCAHNAPKAEALVASLRQAYPERAFHVVAGLLRTKDAAGILAALAALPGDFWLCAPQVFGKASHAPGDLQRAFPPGQAHRIAGLYRDVGHALARVLDAARPGWIILVTGSVYLVGEARDRWFPRAQLLRALAEDRPPPQRDRNRRAGARPPTA